MNNQLTELQDLTLDFIGGHEYLVLVPKGTDTNDGTQPHFNIEPSSAIVAKKITNEDGVQSPQNENLDSRAYRINIGEKSSKKTNPTAFAEGVKNALDRLENKDSSPYSGGLVLSKEDLINQFNIVGILNAPKLNEYISKNATKQNLEFDTYIDIFPECQGQLSSWVNIS
jgi:hypothetical protein